MAEIHCAASFHACYLPVCSLQGPPPPGGRYYQVLCVTDGETEAYGCRDSPKVTKQSGAKLAFKLRHRLSAVKLTKVKCTSLFIYVCTRLSTIQDIGHFHSTRGFPCGAPSPHPTRNPHPASLSHQRLGLPVLKHHINKTLQNGQVTSFNILTFICVVRGHNIFFFYHLVVFPHTMKP